MESKGIRLTAGDARKLMAIKKERFKATLNTIRQMCDLEIRDISRRGLNCIEYDVPRTVMGRDDYDVKKMGRALAKQLFDDDYDVTGTPTRLKISWGTKQDAQYSSFCPDKIGKGRERERENGPRNIASIFDMIPSMQSTGSSSSKNKNKKNEKVVSVRVPL